MFFAVISIENTMTYKSGFFSGFMGQIFALLPREAKTMAWGLGVQTKMAIFAKTKNYKA